VKKVATYRASRVHNFVAFQTADYSNVWLDPATGP
jgi:hypothetical protein